MQVLPHSEERLPLGGLYEPLHQGFCGLTLLLLGTEVQGGIASIRERHR